MNPILLSIRKKMETLPSRQRKLSTYILDHPNEVSSLTIYELAERVGVGTATVLRTVKSLGYDRYSDFKAAFRTAVLDDAKYSYPTYWEMVINQSGRLPDLSMIIQGSAEQVGLLNNPFLIGQIEVAAQKIRAARRVAILGLRTSKSIALALEHSLMNLDVAYLQLSHASDFLLDYIVELREDDLLLAIVSAPMAVQTVQALQICKKRNIPTVVITAVRDRTIGTLADTVISTESFESPISRTLNTFLVELLMIELGKYLAVPQSHLSKVEDLAKEYGIEVWAGQDESPLPSSTSHP